MKTIEERKSIRSYLDKEVEEEKLLAVLEAGRLAPSARNRQQWHFYVVSNVEYKKAIMAISRDQSMIAEAPILLVVTATDDYVMGCKIPAYVVDPTIALTHMLLEANAQGLGTCWIGSYDQDAIKEILSIPVTETVVGITPLGYANDVGRERSRKELTEIVSYIK